MIFGLFIHYFIGATYFLKGDFVYKFSYDTMDVEKGFPKNLKRYFIKCPRQKCEFYNNSKLTFKRFKSWHKIILARKYFKTLNGTFVN